MSILNRLMPALAVALAGIFFGIAVYISLAEQPGRLALPAGAMLAQWKISFAAGIAIQGALAVATGLAGLLVWWIVRDWRWAAGGLLMLANWPWTLVLIAPINAALNGTAAQAASAETVALVQRWGHLHGMRVVLGLCGLLLFVWAMTQDRAERRG